MTEIDALKYDLQKSEDAFNKLHKKYITLLKQQGGLERENEQLKKELEMFKPIMFQDMRKGTVILYRKGDVE